ncbi:TetR/AcrR family transcriptional regulator [Actinoplanes sp. GCM10030250]|uniref:TetR/AcrR family transcriptional regulator n=1 Tax=Actinoplanes sp. GCM10030250 TaxID=3273376 RepID=UPI00360FBD16
MAGRRTDTRERILRVALELFAEQGYDRTSLRQISDRLQITKASLYYHFQSKEEILEAILGEFAERLTNVVAWGRGRPPGPETRHELLRRYSEIITEAASITQSNAFQEFAVATQIRTDVLALLELLTGPDATTAGRLRAQLAIAALHIGLTPGGLTPMPTDDPELPKIALDLAAQLVEGE